jgi:hypothetical protein
MRHIAIWSENDRHLMDILANFMITDFEMVSKMFREIKQEARKSAVHVAA